MNIRFFSYGILNIVHGNCKHFLRFDLCHSVLKNQSKRAGYEIRNDDAAEQPTLKRVSNSLRGFLSEKALVTEKRNQDDRHPHSDRVAEHHRPSSTLDKLKCLRGIIHIRNKYQYHVDNFADNGNANTIRPRRLFVVKHQLSEPCRHKSGKNRSQATCKLRISAGSPIYGKPAVKTTDKSRNDSCRRSENQTCGKRRSIAYVYNGAKPFHSETRCKRRYASKKNTDDDLLCHIR